MLEVVVVLDGVTLQWRRILCVRDEFHWFVLARCGTCVAITLRFLLFVICGWILGTTELNGTDAVLVGVEFAWQIAGIAIGFCFGTESESALTGCFLCENFGVAYQLARTTTSILRRFGGVVGLVVDGRLSSLAGHFLYVNFGVAYQLRPTTTSAQRRFGDVVVVLVLLDRLSSILFVALLCIWVCAYPLFYA